MPVLESSEQAAISTARISINTLVVNDKQMTLAVFRQLKNVPIIDAFYNWKPRGKPWGHVNYFWGDCKEGTHLHVVWQHGEELCRSCVFPIPERGWLEWNEQDYVDALRAIVCHEALNGREPKAGRLWSRTGCFWLEIRRSYHQWRIQALGSQSVTWVEPDYVKCVRRVRGEQRKPNTDEADLICRVGHDLESSNPFSEDQPLFDALQTDLDRAASFREEYIQTYNELAETKQLFIAV